METWLPEVIIGLYEPSGECGSTAAVTYITRTNSLKLAGYPGSFSLKSTTLQQTAISSLLCTRVFTTARNRWTSVYSVHLIWFLFFTIYYNQWQLTNINNNNNNNNNNNIRKTKSNWIWKSTLFRRLQRQRLSRSSWLSWLERSYSHQHTYGALLVPPACAYTFSFFWRDIFVLDTTFSFGATFGHLARLFFIWRDFFYSARLSLFGATFFSCYWEQPLSFITVDS